MSRPVQSPAASLSGRRRPGVCGGPGREDQPAVNQALSVGAAAAAATVYVAPALTAAARRHPQLLAILAVNLFLGWTVLGWAAVLARACRDSGSAAARRDA